MVDVPEAAAGSDAAAAGNRVGNGSAPTVPVVDEVPA
jgi:hypothetical protein